MKRVYMLFMSVIAKIFVILTRVTGFFNMSIFVSKLSFTYGNKIRYYYYKTMLNSVGENVLFSYGTIFSHTDIKIGNNVRFGPNNTVGLIDFEDDILIAQNVHFLSGKNQHDFDRRDITISKQSGELKRIKIESDAWIGCGSIIMDNIKRGSVVGAGSVVTKEVEEYIIVAGNPAKKIKKR